MRFEISTTWKGAHTKLDANQLLEALFVIPIDELFINANQILCGGLTK